MEILNSRVDKEEEQKSNINAEEDGQLVPWRPEILITPSEGRQRYTERTVIGYSREKSDVSAYFLYIIQKFLSFSTI